MNAETRWENLVLLIDRLSPDDPLNPRPVYRYSGYPRRSNYDGPADQPPPSTGEEAHLYERLRTNGAHLERAMEDPSVACGVRRNTMTLDDLEISDSWEVKIRTTNLLPYGYENSDVADLELPEGPFKKFSIELPKNENDTYLGTSWVGLAKEGVLFVERIARKDLGPYASELGIMAYERVAALSTLKTMFVANIVNQETRPVARTIRRGAEFKTFERGSPEFRALLGTGIGRVVAYTVLGAFGQGVKRVSKISLWWIGPRGDSLQMRFDIEDV
ncbi:hypothetical protein PEBR_11258 [Penicillium brasilianum]|uniref:Uncharacterized protein n=1 Tax=Penicillium brasilianum TaxID=104259 RepID=A0A1S9RT85_PENBI|nr:hypothetical protein PEBR_11258 [Penicillium brasilianum]